MSRQGAEKSRGRPQARRKGPEGDNMSRHDENKAPRPPAEALDTVRHLIIAGLEEGPLSALDISGLVGIPEKEVAGHLEHIRQSLSRSGKRLVIQPAECAKCGFVFEKRGRLTRPGKCPVCKGESIHAPVFRVEGK